MLCRNFISNAAVSLLLISSIAPLAFAQSWDMSLSGFVDQHPFAQFHQQARAESPDLNKVGEIKLLPVALWSNTYDSRSSSFVIDSETRTFDLTARYGLTDTTTINLNAPLRWNGGGFTDSGIKNWDSFLGVPNRRRERAQDDQYAFAGKNDDGSTFEIKDRGLALGDLSLGLREFLLGDKSGRITGGLDFSIPTHTSQYGSDSIDITGIISGGEHFGSVSIFGGGAVSLFNDKKEAGLNFHQWQYTGFLRLAWEFVEDWRVGTGVQFQTAAVKDVREYPDSARYIDLFIQSRIISEGNGTRWLGIIIRENLGDPASTVDITAALTGEFSFGLSGSS